MASASAAATAYFGTMALVRALPGGSGMGRRLERVGSLQPQAVRVEPRLKRSLQRIRAWDRMERLLRSADWRVTPEEYLVIVLVAGIGLFAFVALSTGNLWFGSALSGFVVLVAVEAPRLAGRKRMVLFDEQLEQALATMANSLKAGLSLVQAVEVAAKEGQTPLRAEFEKVLEEYRVGLPLNEAFERLRDRIDSEDLKFFTQALSVHRESGGNLVEILSGLSGTIRDRRMLRGELQSKTAEARSAANVLLIAPPALSLYFFVFQPNLVSPLFEESTGKLALGYAAISWAAGVLAVRRVLDMPETR